MAIVAPKWAARSRIERKPRWPGKCRRCRTRSRRRGSPAACPRDLLADKIDLPRKRRYEVADLTSDQPKPDATYIEPITTDIVGVTWSVEKPPSRVGRERVRCVYDGANTSTY